VFETGSNRTNQITNFTTADSRIRAIVGQQFDPYILESIEKMKVIVPPKPTIVTEADGTVSKMEEIKYGKKYNRWLTRTEKVEREMKQVYSIYYGQCDEDIKSCLAEDPTFKRVNEEKDLIQLYKILHCVNFSYKPSQEPILTMWNAKRDFINLKQQRHQSVQEYYERFMALREVNETLNTNIHDDLGFVEAIARENREDVATLTEDKKTEYMSQGCEQMAAMHLLMGADSERYGTAIEDFECAYLMDRKNTYPKTLHDAYILLKGWKKSGSGRNRPMMLSVSFNTIGDNEDGTSLVNQGTRYNGPPCTRCGRRNHPMEKCIAKCHDDGTVLRIDGNASRAGHDEVSNNSLHSHIGHAVCELMFVNSDDTHSKRMDPKSSSSNSIPSTWILLDSQSTIDVFSNAKLLEKIEKVGTTMHIQCNAGVKSTNLRGHLSGYGWVWYFPQGITNILSLSRVKEKFRVMFDSSTDNCFHVHKEEKILKFREAMRRLYYSTLPSGMKSRPCS
jgi:hypothetical protein